MNVYLSDEGRRTGLPVEAFEGQSFLEPLQQLQQEWQAILNLPTGREADCSSRLRNLLIRQIHTYQTTLRRHELAINYFRQYLQWIENTIYNESRKAVLMNAHELTIRRYQQARRSQRVSTDKLQALQRNPGSTTE